MSVPNDNRRDEYTQTDAITVDYAYNFKITDSTHIGVYLDGVLQAGGYTVNGVGAETGTITFSSVPAEDTVITLLHKVPLLQSTVYPIGSKFPAAAHEGALDNIVRQNLQQQEVIDRCVQWPVEVGNASSALPNPNDVANQDKALFIAADGSGLETRSIGDADMQSVLTGKGGLVTHTGVGAIQIPVGEDGAALHASSAAASGLEWRINPPQEWLDNRLMNVWQRGATSMPDRYWLSHVSDAVVTIQRSDEIPNPIIARIFHNYSLLLGITTADTTLSGTQHLTIYQPIEGYDARKLLYHPFTVSWWVRCTKTGKHSFSVTNRDTDFGFVQEYTISVSNKWERHSVTVPPLEWATVTGGWSSTDNTGFRFGWTFASGTSKQTSSLGVWQASTATVATGQVNSLDSTSNTIHITGLQVDLGSKANFVRPTTFQDDLQRAQRYFQKSYAHGIAPGTVNGSAVGSQRLTATGAGIHSLMVNMPVTMRLVPTVTIYSTSTGTAGKWRNTTLAADVDGTVVNAGVSSFAVTTPGTVTEGHVFAFDWAANSEMT